MREMSVREANQNFSQVIAAAEAGETIIITKNGAPVARITPQAADRSADTAWVKAHAALAQNLRRPRASQSVGAITEDDLYGEDD
jgi:prevent-host-death family protein